MPSFEIFSAIINSLERLGAIMIINHNTFEEQILYKTIKME